MSSTKLQINKKLEIGNWKLEIPAPRAGFTLIELLASVMVFIGVGVVLAVILYSSLRGTTKTTNLTQVKQNGYFVLAQMSKMLRNAQKLDAPTLCIVPWPTPPLQYSSLTFLSPDGKQTTFSCDMSASKPTISSNSASLLDTAVVSLQSCTFTCRQNSITEPPIIGISFVLKQAVETSSSEFTTTDVPFETSLVLRNSNR